MASKIKASTSLFLSLNLLFFSFVSSHISKGSPIINSRNPVVIRARAMHPNGNKLQSQGQCNSLNLGVCVNLLGLVDIETGNVPTQPCCGVIQGLVDLEVAVCLCTAIRASVLGIINLNLPINLSLLLNNCGRKPAVDYMCSP
ncbi:hypothetical protein DITRI_Ditri09bG0065900 [Diplodiscus trichospermus]